MNLLYTFNNFYGNLSSNGILFFWITIILVIILITLIVSLYLKNKKLTNLLKYNIMETKEDNIEKEEDLPIIEKEKEIIKEPEIEIKEESIPTFEIAETVEEPKIEEIPKENAPYSKNVLREMNTRMQTSPIHIEKKDEKVIRENENLIELDYGEDAKSPLELMEDSYEINENMKFASEIVDRMEEEIKPSNIELTDYEKKQEEEAIISYDELVKVKDKIYNITEDEETDEFIDELKTFRLDLE